MEVGEGKREKRTLYGGTGEGRVEGMRAKSGPIVDGEEVCSHMSREEF